MAVNKEIISRWVSALRSGKYEQDNGYLHADGRFCCLGVLCDLVKDEISLNVRRIPGNIPDRFLEWDGEELFEYDGESSFLPAKVAGLIGISASGDLPEEYWYKTEHSAYSLIQMNDDGVSFDEISNVIEKVWLHD